MVSTNGFTFSLSNAPAGGGSFTATLTITDGATNSSTATRTYWLPGAPPVVTLTQIQPEFGPAVSGSDVIVQVEATSHAALSNLAVTVMGSGPTWSFSTNSSQLRLLIPVPPTAVPGQDVLVTPCATDVAGRPARGPASLSRWSMLPPHRCLF